MESKRLVSRISNNDKESKDRYDKFLDYRKWVINNLLLFLKYLNQTFQNDDIKLQTVAVRTLTEFVKREYMFADIGNAEVDNRDIDSKKRYGLRTYEYFIKALINAKQIDVDILLMIRSEVSFD